MCVDFTDLNQACPKDLYPLPNIDRFIDGALGYWLLNFNDAYSRCSQINMSLYDTPKTGLMTNNFNIIQGNVVWY